MIFGASTPFLFLRLCPSGSCGGSSHWLGGWWSWDFSHWLFGTWLSGRPLKRRLKNWHRCSHCDQLYSWICRSQSTCPWSEITCTHNLRRDHNKRNIPQIETSQKMSSFKDWVLGVSIQKPSANLKVNTRFFKLDWSPVDFFCCFSFNSIPTFKPFHQVTLSSAESWNLNVSVDLMAETQ